jgi:hypothetical protein
LTRIQTDYRMLQCFLNTIIISWIEWYILTSALISIIIASSETPLNLNVNVNYELSTAWVRDASAREGYLKSIHATIWRQNLNLKWLLNSCFKTKVNTPLERIWMSKHRNINWQALDNIETLGYLVNMKLTSASSIAHNMTIHTSF